MLLGFLFIVLIALLAWNNSSPNNDDYRRRQDHRHRPNDYQDQEWDDRHGYSPSPHYPYYPYPPQYPPPYPPYWQRHSGNEGTSFNTIMATIVVTIIMFSGVAFWAMNKLGISFKVGDGQKPILIQDDPRSIPPPLENDKFEGLVPLRKQFCVIHGEGDLNWARAVKTKYSSRHLEIFRRQDNRYEICNFVSTIEEIGEKIEPFELRQQDAFENGFSKSIYYETKQICSGQIVRKENDDIWFCQE